MVDADERVRAGSVCKGDEVVVFGIAGDGRWIGPVVDQLADHAESVDVLVGFVGGEVAAGLLSLDRQPWVQGGRKMPRRHHRGMSAVTRSSIPDWNSAARGARPSMPPEKKHHRGTHASGFRRIPRTSDMPICRGFRLATGAPKIDPGIILHDPEIPFPIRVSGSESSVRHHRGGAPRTP